MNNNITNETSTTEAMVNLTVDNPINRDLMNQCNAGILEAAPSVLIRRNLLSELVPENELAIDEPDETTDTILALKDAEELGCFSPAVGMAQITGLMNNRIFALHYIDEQGNHIFKFCERYEDGTYSPQMSITQGELFLLNACGFNVRSIVVPALKTKATQILSNLTLDYFNKYNGDDPLDVADILRAIMQVRNKLPIRQDMPSECASKEFYLKIVEAIKRNGSLSYWVEDNTHKSYYAFNDEAMKILAEELEMKVQELLKKLKDYEFLYLTKSSNGLKTKVRFKGIEKGTSEIRNALREEFGLGDSYTEWAYCIWKLQNIGEMRK